MSEPPKQSWTEADVQGLIGQSESIRREFKSGVMFERDPENKWIKDLSVEVSALANTEGGELILGMDEERKSRPRVATIVDGVSTAVAPERLQQLIEGNVSPYLFGIRVHRVKLSARSDRVVFVIYVPQGSTAYQANDGRYYGRSEFEAKYLPDHEIRLRMSRGKIARASVKPRLGRVVLGAAHEAELRTNHAAAIEAFKTNAADAITRFPEFLDLMAARYHPDEISFSLVLRNDGELTIRDPAVQFSETVLSSCSTDGPCRLARFLHASICVTRSSIPVMSAR
jgi:Putative DNA-binding domain